MGSRCQSCGALHLPPRALCPACYGDEMEWEQISGKGKLVAFTTVHIAPTAMIEAGYGRENPYCAGIVQLDEGPGHQRPDHGRGPGQAGGDRRSACRCGSPLSSAARGKKRRTYLAFEKV